MKKIIFLFLMIILLLGCIENKPTNNENIGGNKMNFKITSSAFLNNGKIPKKYSCQGEDINPELNFENIPENTKTLVLIMDDPDAPVGLWVHWLLFNIPVKSSSFKIDENSIPKNALQGINSWGKNNYGGPCPPDREHRYFFKAYALDSFLELDENATKEKIEKAMQEKIIEKAELIGLYEKD